MINKTQAQAELNEVKKRIQNLQNIIDAPEHNQPVRERVSNFNDILREADITQMEFYDQCKGDEPDEVGYKKCKLIVKTLNGGKPVNFADSNQRKYRAWMEYNTNRARFVFDYTNYINSNTDAGLGPRLYFFCEEDAKFFATVFENEINEYMLG